MDNLKKFFIDGKWVEPATSETMKVLNPSNDETIGIVALGSDEDVNNAVKVAKRAFETYSKTTKNCLLYTSPSPRDKTVSRMPSSA